MRCNVPFCTSKTTRRGTEQEISLFSLPKEPNIRKAWIKALGTNWEPNKTSFICSEHFRQEDFYETTDGKRVLHDGVLPLKILDCDELAALRVCRICLVMDAKMYDFAQFDQMFEQITGILTSEEESRWLPQQLCWECAARLKAAADFRDKAFISDSLLHDLLTTSKQIKIRDIKTINRKNIGLKTSLLQTVIDCQHYELNVKDTFVVTSQNSDSDNETKYTENREEILETNSDNNTPVNNIPVNNIPVNNTPVNNIPVNNILVNNIPVNNIPVNNILINNIPVNNIPVNNIPVNNVPMTNDTTLLIYLPNKNTNVTNNMKLSDEFNYSDKETPSNDEFKNKTELEDGIENNIIEGNQNIYVPKKNGPSDIVFEDSNSYDGIMTDEKYLATVEVGDEDQTNIGHVDISQYVTLVPADLLEKPYVRYNRVKKPMVVDETIFEIQQLSYDEQMKEFEARKESSSYINCPYKCTVCYKGFASKDYYNSHVPIHYEENGAYECYLCMKRFKTAQTLRTHTLATHTVQYNCRLCKFRTRHKHIAIPHVRLHQGKTFKCSLCPMEFQIHSTYFGHLRFQHMLDWVCDLCGFTFVNTNGLRQHKRKKHRLITAETPREGPYCEVCDIKFLSQEAHDTHLRVSPKHLDGERDPMRIRNTPSLPAPRRSRKASSLRPNGRKPRGPNTPVTCEQCGLDFCNFPKYELHFKIDHPGATMMQPRIRLNPVMCELCGQIFKKSVLLRQHMSVHTTEKNFLCDHCSRGFKYKTSLVNHLNSHLSEGERKNQCPACHKYFSSVSNLKKHLLIHTGLKPYQCDTCKKSFITRSECGQHIKHAHLNVPWPRKKKKENDEYQKAVRVES